MCVGLSRTGRRPRSHGGTQGNALLSVVQSAAVYYRSECSGILSQRMLGELPSRFTPDGLKDLRDVSLLIS